MGSDSGLLVNALYGWKRAAHPDSPQLWATKRTLTGPFHSAGPRQDQCHGLPESEGWHPPRSG